MLKPSSYMFEKWTKQAIECYSRNCNCAGCELELFCMEQDRGNTYNMIPMKWAVLMLYRRLGKPKGEMQNAEV